MLMENNNLDTFLTEKMSVLNLELEEPRLELIVAARQKIASRKQKVKKAPGVFTALSGFFNLQIKLYQASLATLIIVGYIYFFTKTEIKTEQKIITQYVTERSSVNSSTVLATILTFIAR